MQEADEQDTCRICSAPAEPDQPLFHPCKCSGTIRYIHQDCLTTWLAHSKKKTCDVCKHPYAFTKVYASDMPSSLPLVLLIRRLLQQAFLVLVFIIRAIVVAAIWLGVLPWVTVWTWRMYFAMGDSAAWWISNRPRPILAEPEDQAVFEPPVPPPNTLIGHITTHPLWTALSADIFTGQIIASLIVLTFVAIFLLREWISQNARPGVFEDEEPLPEIPLPLPPVQPPPPQHQEQPPAQAGMELPRVGMALAARRAPGGFLDDENLLQRQIEALRAIEAMRIRNAQDQRGAGRIAAAGPPRWDDEEAIQKVLDTVGRKRRRKEAQAIPVEGGAIGKGKQAQVGGGGGPRNGAEAESMERVRMRQKRRSIALAKKGRKLLKGETTPTPSFLPTPNQGESSSNFKFPTTFPHYNGTDASASSPSPSASRSTVSPNPIPALPFSLRSTPTSLSTSAASTPSPGPYPPRPPLPNTVIDGLPSPATTRALGSPSLATYRAPEEFGTPEAGPSRSSYFAMDDSSIGSLVAEQSTSGAPVFVEDDEDDENREYQIERFPHDREELPETEGLDEDEDKDEECEIKHFPDDEGEPLPRKESAEVQVEAHMKEEVDDDDDEAIARTPLLERLQAAQNAKSAGASVWGGDDGNVSDVDIDMEAETKRFFREQRDRTAPLLGEDGEGQGSSGASRFAPTAVHASGTDTSDGESGESGVEDRDNANLPVRPDGAALRARGAERRERERVWDRVVVDMNDEAGLFRDGDEEEEELREDDFGMQWVDEEELELEEEGEDGEPHGDLGRAHALPPPVPGAPPPPPVPDANQDAEMAAALEANEDLEAGEDEMEGAMEAVGLRGPVFGVLQNAALMIFVLDTAIGIGVWVPYTIGKTAALLSLDPRRLLEVLHFPIRAIRLVTDPIVDLVAFIFTGILWLFVAFAKLSFLGDTWVDRVSTAAEKAYTKSMEILKPMTEFAFSSSSTTTDHAVWNITAEDSLLSAIPDYLGFTEPYFEALGKEVRVTTVNAQSTWIQLALGNGPTNRIFAVVLGYIVVSFILALYLNILTVGNARSAGRAVRSAVRQQLLVLKVAAFIFIELVTFPLACGMVLDFCMIWLFPQASIHSRLSSILHAPLTAMFYHWMAGTTFMYGFAMLLAGARTVIRPGAMWFIKDPADQNSHPIREILDRPTLVQLRKIMLSGLMYAVVVACIVASLGGLLLLGRKSILPFRWRNRQPLSKVPVDLLFLHLVLPYTMHYFRPKRATKSFVLVIWKFLARQLRLSSYFFGGRYPNEEQPARTWTELLYGTPVEADNEEKAVELKQVDGGFRRVPATDNLALPREIRATLAVTETGEPFDDAARALMELQNSEAEKAGHLVKDDYMIIYTPPYFKYRIILFILLLWSAGALVAGVGIALPILLGRSVFRLYTPADVHDGYALILGIYLVWACYLVAQAVDRLDKRRQRRSSGGDGPRAHLYVLVLKRGLPWLAKTLYMVFWLGVVIPILIAAVVDLYVVLPIRLTLDPAMVPRMRVVDLWALGLLYAKLGLHLHRMQPPNRISRGLRHILAHGWTRPYVIMATKEFIAPLVGGLLAMILFPGAVFRVIQYVFPNLPVDNRFMFNHVYPSVFILAGSARSVMALYGVLLAWSQAIRDTEFLVEMRLKNHEPEAAAAEVKVKEEGEGNGEGKEKDRIGGEGEQTDAEVEVEGEGEIEAPQTAQEIARAEEEEEEEGTPIPRVVLAPVDVGRVEVEAGIGVPVVVDSVEMDVEDSLHREEGEGRREEDATPTRASMSISASAGWKGKEREKASEQESEHPEHEEGVDVGDREEEMREWVGDDEAGHSLY